MRGTRLFWKLYPSYLLITVLSLLVAGWFAAEVMREFYQCQVAADLKAKAQLVGQELLADPFLLGYPEKADQYCKQTGRLIATRITLILPSGKVVGDSHKNPLQMDNHGDRPEVTAALASGHGSSVRYSHTLDTYMMYVALALKRGAATMAVVRTSMALAAIDHALARIRKKILAGSVAACLLAGILCFFVSRRISKPMEELASGLKGSFQDKKILPRYAPSECHMLEEAMGRMARELDQRMETLTRQRNQLEAILTSMSEGVIAVDQDGRLAIVNLSAASMLGLDVAAAKGRSLQEAVRNPELQELVSRVLAGSGPARKEIAVLAGRQAILQVHGVALRSARQDGLLGALVVLTDITRLRQAERMRKDFVANVSHELKTPITAIKGFAETLLDGSSHDPDHVSRFLNIIATHARRMEKIVQDLLTLARLENQDEGRAVEFEQADLGQVVARAIQACALEAGQKGIQIETRVADGLCLEASSHLLEQALVNLVENAVKYSGSGSRVTVTAGRQAGQVVICVADQGCGIARQHQARIFERFYRVDKARSRKLGGTGLGLAIVKHVAQIHGGKVEVESSVGKGSIFTIILPHSS